MNYKGATVYALFILDPSQVFVGTALPEPNPWGGQGLTLDKLAEQYGALAGVNAEDYDLTSDTMWVKDVRGGDLLIFNGSWAVRWAEEKNPGLILTEFHQDIQEG